MRRGKAVVLAAVLIGVVTSKFVLPELGAGLRNRLDTVIENETESVATFAQRIQLLSAELDEEQQTMVQAEQEISAQKPSYIFVDVVSSSEPVDITVPSDEEMQQPMPTEEIVEVTPEPLPAAVAAFLESQSTFADYDIPEKVNYNYVNLPFEHATPVAGYNSSGFGYRLHPILNTVRFHYGTDFAAYTGERVLAFAEGTVTFAGYDESFGWHVRIKHGEDWETLYAHCSQLYVTAGETVSAGECIALVGASGLATGPHLHFELTMDGKYLNPEYYINS